MGSFLTPGWATVFVKLAWVQPHFSIAMHCGCKGCALVQWTCVLSICIIWLHVVSSTWRFVNFFDVSSTFLTFRQLFWHFVNFFLLTPNLTKKVDETSIQKVDETSVPQPRPGPWLLTGVWRRPYTGVSGRPVFACLQPVRRREFSWVYTGVVLASNVANRVYRFYTFRFSTTVTEKIVLLYEKITYASALS